MSDLDPGMPPTDAPITAADLDILYRSGDWHTYQLHRTRIIHILESGEPTEEYDESALADIRRRVDIAWRLSPRRTTPLGEGA